MAMEEKMEKALGEFFEKLTDEQKTKAKECKTPEELMDFLGKEEIELPDELLDSVAGGFTPLHRYISEYKPPRTVDPTFDQPSIPRLGLK